MGSERKVGEFAVVKVSPWVEHIPTAWIVRAPNGSMVAGYRLESEAFAEASRLNAVEMRRRSRSSGEADKDG